jgi:oligosaccharide repeat unit polymerase
MNGWNISGGANSRVTTRSGESIMVLVIFLFVFFILTAFNYILGKHFLYPPFVFSFIWLVVLLLYMSVKFPIIPLSLTTLLLVLAGAVSYTVGALAVNLKRYSILRPTKTSYYERTGIKNLLFFVPFVLLPFYVLKGFQLAHSSGVGRNLFFDIRYEVAVNHGTYGGIGYAVPVAYFVLFIHLIRTNSRETVSKLKIISLVFCDVIYAFFSTGRTYFILLIVGAIATSFIMGRRLRIRNIIMFLCAAVISFTVLAVLTDKGYTPGHNLTSNVGSITQAFKIYIVGGLGAFQYMQEYLRPSYAGADIFRTVIQILHKFGIATNAPNLVQPYAYIPFPFNVYTFFGTYFEDFGAIGILVASFLFGLIQTNLFHRARKGDPLYIYLFALLLYPLIMVFFEDQYMSLLSEWIQFWMYGFVYYRLLNTRGIPTESGIGDHIKAKGNLP